MKHIDPSTQSLLDMAGYALSHALWTAPEGNLVPFIISEDGDGERELARFMVPVEEALKDAHQHPRWAMAQMGYIDQGTPDETAVMRVEFGRLSRNNGSVMWAFKPATGTSLVARMFRKFTPLELIDGPEIAFGKRDKDLIGGNTPEARKALLDGMKSHDRAWKQLAHLPQKAA
jgi:hypothetical protein